MLDEDSILEASFRIALHFFRERRCAAVAAGYVVREAQKARLLKRWAAGEITAAYVCDWVAQTTGFLMTSMWERMFELEDPRCVLAVLDPIELEHESTRRALAVEAFSCLAGAEALTFLLVEVCTYSLQEVARMRSTTPEDVLAVLDRARWKMGAA